MLSWAGTTVAKDMNLIPELTEIRKNGSSNLQHVEYVFNSYMKEKAKKVKDQVNEVHVGNCYMSDSEEGILVNMAILMANYG